MRLFTNSLEAEFTGRPNRFIVHASCGGKELIAHCPNPGRMIELLVPGRRLILEESRDPRRRTPYTLVGAYYQGKVIPLYASRANAVARELVIPRLYPGAGEVQGERTVGSSRFDFGLNLPGGELLLEVKSCTLVEYGVGMFPDAPTLRGLRHLKELGERGGAVLFLLAHPDAKRFIPNLHTDPAFSLALWQLQDRLTLHCASIHTTAAGEATLVRSDIPLDLEPVRYCREDRGCYLLVIRMAEEQTCRVGALGSLVFPPGYYVYAGSGKKYLGRRLHRHCLKRKPLRWHIDYLTVKAARVTPYPIYTGRDLECALAAALAGVAEESYPGFGCSDCRCPSHLFYFSGSPLAVEGFREILLKFRHKLAFC